MDTRVPPDPDGLNDERAQWAQQAIERFQFATGSEDDTALLDLLTDLMHFADRSDEDFEAALAVARQHYNAETDPKGGW